MCLQIYELNNRDLVLNVSHGTVLLYFNDVIQYILYYN